MREFSVTYDRMTKILSALVCVGLLAMALVSHVGIVALLPVLVISLAYAWSPRGYVVSNDAILVKRVAGSVSIPLEGLREARKTTPEDFAGCLRLWGNGGLFGYYGLFRTSKLGTCRWYVTDRSRTVVVIAAGQTVVLSPDDVDGFLAALPASATTSPGVACAGNGPIGKAPKWPIWIGAAGIVLALIVIGMALNYSPGLPRTTLTPESLTIHDRFYPATLKRESVYLAGLRVVDLVSDPEWRPHGRINGFSNSHYHSGWYRLASGERAEMYWTSGTRLVLLPRLGGEAPVLFETNDPEGFVARVRAQWTR